MGRFLREAVDSVLHQDYPRVEYIVMDGGSSDETLAILESYGPRLRFESHRDSGPAEAVNRGFALARGSILAYLAADDSYLPGAISAAVRFLEEHPEHAGVYGNAWWVDEVGQIVSRYPTETFCAAELARRCFICQPACFLRREAVEAVGGLDPDLAFSYDYELWMRMARTFTLGHIPQVLARSRMHRNNRTLGQRAQAFEETMRVLRRHYGYVPFSWVYAQCAHAIDRRDQFFEPLEPSLAKYVASLPAGLRWNWRHPLRYLSEWAGVMNWSAARRRMRFLKAAPPDALRFPERHP
jgi:glycosyltransferase involved in cell wall biosynthesis